MWRVKTLCNPKFAKRTFSSIIACFIVIKYQHVRREYRVHVCTVHALPLAREPPLSSAQEVEVEAELPAVRYAVRHATSSVGGSSAYIVSLEATTKNSPPPAAHRAPGKGSVWLGISWWRWCTCKVRSHSKHSPGKCMRRLAALGGAPRRSLAAASPAAGRGRHTRGAARASARRSGA